MIHGTKCKNPSSLLPLNSSHYPADKDDEKHEDCQQLLQKNCYYSATVTRKLFVPSSPDYTQEDNSAGMLWWKYDCNACGSKLLASQGSPQTMGRWLHYRFLGRTLPLFEKCRLSMSVKWSSFPALCFCYFCVTPHRDIELVILWSVIHIGASTVEWMFGEIIALSSTILVQPVLAHLALHPFQRLHIWVYKSYHIKDMLEIKYSYTIQLLSLYSVHVLCVLRSFLVTKLSVLLSLSL